MERTHHKDNGPKTVAWTIDEEAKFWSRAWVAPSKRWAKAKPDLTPCWHWLGTKTKDGYAWYHFRGKTQKGHRVSYEHFIGPCPAGLVPDHLCRVRECVNPSHLEWVTSAENTRRGVAARRKER